jgi:hypothetical protein
LEAEAEVGAEEEERAVEVHLVERDHQVVDAAVGKVVQRLLLACDSSVDRQRPDGSQIRRGKRERKSRGGG